MSKKAAFEKFYLEHIDKVYRFVFFRCQDKAQAEDLVSEIFIKVLNHFDEYDETLSKTSWLMTITKNHLANYWRDRKPTQSIDATLENEDMDNEQQWLKHGLKALKKGESKYQISELLAHLSQNDQELVTMHYLFGYNYAEIGEFVGMTETAVKVATHRAIKEMRKNI
jgi:RNA polymerase sigma-70 factor (ECF subfamily)